MLIVFRYSKSSTYNTTWQFICVCSIKINFEFCFLYSFIHRCFSHPNWSYRGSSTKTKSIRVTWLECKWVRSLSWSFLWLIECSFSFSSVKTQHLIAFGSMEIQWSLYIQCLFCLFKTLCLHSLVIDWFKIQSSIDSFSSS